MRERIESLRERASDAIDELPSWAQRGIELGREMVHEAQVDRMNGLAAEVAFFALLGVFPGLLIVTAMLGWLDSLLGKELATQAQDAVLSGMDRVLTDNASQATEAVRSLFAEQRGGILTFAIVGALWALSRSFAAVIVALDVAYDLEERRPWLKKRAVGIGLSLGSVLVVALVLAMIVIGPLLGGGRAVADQVGLGGVFAFLWTWLRWPFAFAVLVAWTAAVFHIGPAVATNWRRQLPGAVLSAAAWLVLSIGFSVYLRFAGSGNPVYGILGGGIIMLLWLYLLSLALLAGAELNAILMNWKHAPHPQQTSGS